MYTGSWAMAMGEGGEMGGVWGGMWVGSGEGGGCGLEREERSGKDRCTGR